MSEKKKGLDLIALCRFIKIKKGKAKWNKSFNGVSYLFKDINKTKMIKVLNNCLKRKGINKITYEKVTEILRKQNSIQEDFCKETIPGKSRHFTVNSAMVDGIISEADQNEKKNKDSQESLQLLRDIKSKSSKRWKDVIYFV